jgi:hypothetical protein
MATIKTSDLAPKEKIKFSLVNDTFDLTPSGTYETNDPAVLANALMHPWLVVDYGKQAAEDPGDLHDSVPYDKDVLSAATSEAFDPKAIERDRRTKEDLPLLAVDAGLDQNEPETVGEVAVTLAADDTTPDKKKKGDS